MKFRAASIKLLERGWVSIPLGLDAAGKPKRPLPREWPTVRREIVPHLMWGRAQGLGIVLGPASDNLAVIDIDHQGLARAVFSLLAMEWTLTKLMPRMVFTGRNNLHVYVREDVPSASTSMRRDWHEHADISIELKGQGTQVAAPPTPGYTLATGAALPLRVHNIGEYWQRIAEALQVTAPDTSDGRTASGYPAPWQPSVLEGDRNNAIYVEASRLCDAGLTLEQAYAHMKIRVETAYQKGIGWLEVQRTIRSAYRKQQLPPQGPRKGVSRKWR